MADRYKNYGQNEALVAAVWRSVLVSALSSGRVYSVARTEADQAVVDYKTRFYEGEDGVRPERDGELKPGQCAHCGGAGPYFTSEEVLASSKGLYTHDNVCKWCRCSVFQVERPATGSHAYAMGPSQELLEKSGYLVQEKV